MQAESPLLPVFIGNLTESMPRPRLVAFLTAGLNLATRGRPCFVHRAGNVLANLTMQGVTSRLGLVRSCHTGQVRIDPLSELLG
jgi:hypothetical protein